MIRHIVDTKLAHTTRPKMPDYRKILAARDTSRNIPSLNEHSGSTAKRETQKYTGTECIGISTMHKSNAVPVFSSEMAVATAAMRRG